MSVIGAIYYQNIKNVANDADPIMYSLRLKYAMSKRTDLYLSTAYAKAKNNQLVGLSRDDVGCQQPVRHDPGHAAPLLMY
jgi:predicted porin